VEPGDPACVFFTSGTTGPPKGVVSPHRATTRLFAADGPLPFGPRHVMLQAAPTAWDAWSLELWGMLTTGGTSVVVPEHYLLPHTLAAAVAAHGVTTAWLTSSLFNMLVVEEPECFAGLRHVLVGGERLSPEHVRTFLAAHPDVHLLNGYGPVESCVFATVHPVRAADCDVPGGIPIGRPVPGTGIHLLGDELCVSGDGLALRYLGDETSTAHAFPTLDLDGHAVRVFRTGDTGFRDADGTWHFTGRSDRQVKIRGHRIEPDGVEAEAAALPQVASCAAVPLPGALGTYERLALFYTPRPGTGHAPGGDPSGVRAALARTLPRHCVPDLVRAVERLPVTPNGKVDHAALAAYAADA
jgi:non-ribosomal peptide synthetase component F